jgi:hypothetical protein
MTSATIARPKAGGAFTDPWCSLKSSAVRRYKCDRKGPSRYDLLRPFPRTIVLAFAGTLSYRRTCQAGRRRGNASAGSGHKASGCRFDHGRPIAKVANANRRFEPRALFVADSMKTATATSQGDRALAARFERGGRWGISAWARETICLPGRDKTLCHR